LNTQPLTLSEQQSFHGPWRPGQQDDSIKSASAPPRGGAREPSMQLLAFHLDRANRLLELMQRRAYGCAAPALRRGGSARKIFCWEGEPQRRTYEHNYYVSTYTSGTPEVRHLNRRPPSTSYTNTYMTERAACGDRRA